MKNIKTKFLALFATLALTSNAAVSNEAPESIGSAEMLENGVVVVTARAESSDGAVGDAQFTYKPGEKDYDKILNHIGGLKPGESKQVPPWPEKNQDL